MNVFFDNLLIIEFQTRFRIEFPHKNLKENFIILFLKCFDHPRIRGLGKQTAWLAIVHGHANRHDFFQFTGISNGQFYYLIATPRNAHAHNGGCAGIVDHRPHVFHVIAHGIIVGNGIGIAPAPGVIGDDAVVLAEPLHQWLKYCDSIQRRVDKNQGYGPAPMLVIDDFPSVPNHETGVMNPIGDAHGFGRVAAEGHSLLVMGVGRLQLAQQAVQIAQQHQRPYLFTLQLLHFFNGRQGLPPQLLRGTVGVMRLGLLGGGQGISRGLGPDLAFEKMGGQGFLNFRQSLRVLGFQQFGHLAMQLFAPFQQQGFVGDLLGYHVLEAEYRLGDDSHLPQDFQRLQSFQRGGNSFFRGHEGFQQASAELASDHRSMQHHFPRGVVQPVQAAADHRLHGFGQGQVFQVAGEHRFAHFTDFDVPAFEQRTA